MSTSTAAAATLASLAGTWTIDPSHSRVGFVARHAMVTKVRGAFNDFVGVAAVDAEDFSRSRVSLTIQATSIDTRNEQRDGHLRSNEFFDMDAYPQISFVSTAVAQTGPASLEITGDLTIKGVTRPVTIPFEFDGCRRRPVRQPAGRLRGLGEHQPQGLRRHLERAAGNRGRAGQRQNRAGVRGLGDQERLTHAVGGRDSVGTPCY